MEYCRDSMVSGGRKGGREGWRNVGIRLVGRIGEFLGWGVWRETLQIRVECFIGHNGEWRMEELVDCNLLSQTHVCRKGRVYETAYTSKFLE